MIPTILTLLFIIFLASLGTIFGLITTSKSKSKFNNPFIKKYISTISKHNIIMSKSNSYAKERKNKDYQKFVLFMNSDLFKYLEEK